VTAQVLDRILTAYRIGDPAGAHPVFDATGSKLWPGRWNTADSPTIYASEHYSTAMLEKLAHGNGHMPPHQHWIALTIPPGVSYEVFSTAHHPGWDAEDCRVSKAYGEAWRKSGRSLLLLVPSVVARMERNVLINDEHSEVARITHGLHEPIWWDRRLFSVGAMPLLGASPAPRVGATRRRKPPA
jgi:RES domain-containing protein